MTTALLSLLLAAVPPGQDALRVTGGLAGMTDRYLAGIAKKCWGQRTAAMARVRTVADVKARQAYIGQKLLEEIGGFPARTPLNPRITGTLRREGYRVERLIFESQPNYYVTANVYVPEGAPPPFAAVLGTAGHNELGKAYEIYQRAWIGLVKRGFLVLAYDPPGQGERLEYSGRLPSGVGEHMMAGVQCLLTGTNLARWEIWDGIRAFDYLLTRPDVDPKRIAVAGNSGGGTQSAYLAALEPRLAAAAPSCYITSWDLLWFGIGPADPEQVFSGFLRDGLDFPDFLIAFAPKPIMMLTAVRDYFPIAGARAAYAEARRIFGVLRARDRAGFFEYDDTHGWSQPRREATYCWFSKWLLGKEDDGREPAFETIPEAELRCTATGQVATSIPGAETVRSLNAALAERLYAARTKTGDLRSLLGVNGPRGIPPWDKQGDVEGRGYRIEKIEMQPEPGIMIPMLAFVPVGGAPRKSAALWLDPAGKSADLAGIEALVRADNVVLAADLRNWGESAPPPEPRTQYTKPYQTAQRALLVGKTLIGMQVYDALRAFDFLAARHEVDSRRVTVVGKGNGGVVAIFARALEPRIAAANAQGAPRSYLDLAREPMPQNLIEIAVPGILRDFDLPDLR